MLEGPACWNSQSSGFQNQDACTGDTLTGHSHQKKTVHTRADEIPVTSVLDPLAMVRFPLGEQQQWEDTPARNGKRALCLDWPTCCCLWEQLLLPHWKVPQPSRFYDHPVHLFFAQSSTTLAFLSCTSSDTLTTDRAINNTGQTRKIWCITKQIYKQRTWIGTANYAYKRQAWSPGDGSFSNARL